MPNHEVSRYLGPGRQNVQGAGERKREGFRSLLGQNSGKKYFLCKHFRCSDRRKPLPFEFSTLVPGGAAERCARSAGPYLVASNPKPSITSVDSQILPLAKCYHEAKIDLRVVLSLQTSPKSCPKGFRSSLKG